MQVPAENPIRFRLREFPSKEVAAGRSIPISFEVTNRDGIRSAYVNWRKKGESGWYSYRLAGSRLRDFSGRIDMENYMPGDTIEYFIEAESYNGKRMSKPITAPEGFYQFIIRNSHGICQQKHIGAGVKPDFALRVQPEPESARISVNMPKTDRITLTITDTAGHEIEKPLSSQNVSPGPHSYTVFMDSYPDGTYFCTVSDEEKVLGVQQFDIRH